GANNVIVRLTSTCGITFADQTLSLGAGESRDLVFDFSPDCADCACTFTAEIDPDAQVCECTASNNSMTSLLDGHLPDLEVYDEGLDITCAADGLFRVTGSITLTNSGCGDPFTEDVAVRFTLYNETACGGENLWQWSETFTGITLAPAGGTQRLFITPQEILADAAALNDECALALEIAIDPLENICECDGANNTLCAVKPINIPDLAIAADHVRLSCSGDGRFTVSGPITVTNNGCGANVSRDIPVRLTLLDRAGCEGAQIAQWTQLLGLSELPARGGVQRFELDTREVVLDACAGLAECQASLRIELDYEDVLCESNAENNLWCTNIPVEIPDVTVTRVQYAGPLTGRGLVPVGEVLVDVANVGCSAAENTVVRLDSNCAIVAPDQVIDLASGQTETLSFLFSSPGPGPIQCTFVATADPDGQLCECNAGNNSHSSLEDELKPVLDVVKLIDKPYAVIGERITYTIIISNTGDADADDVTVTDTLPTALAFAGPVTLEGSAGTVAQTAADLPVLASGITVAAGTRVTITFPVQVVGLGEIVNTVVVSSPQTPEPIDSSVIVQADQIETNLTGCQNPFCPGWTLRYSFWLTNTLPTPLVDLVITDVLPLGVCCPVDAPWSQLPGRVNAQGNMVFWQIPSLASGDTVRVGVEVHSYQSLASGTVLTNTYYYSAQNLPRVGQRSIALVADTRLCEPRVTPTPTPSTPTPTPTIPHTGPTEQKSWLPLLYKR
ncbi:MAG: DUF11 domain-containing protein, partial [Chloroflexi bacterium]|nr:DUF11 domain-containing protein [Chloroflexota bacterium]